tara:strand:+ start:2586 stop:3380 length:795 start_codon:yes stop_codon:yes gene_type:complete
MLQKLFTEEDPYHIHKTFGFFCLFNFIFQLSSYALTRQMYLNVYTITPHILLHFSSFIFKVLPKRAVTSDNKIVKKMGMFIWEELRLHSFAFSTRSCLIILFPYMSFQIVVCTMLLADLITNEYGNPNVSTVRGNLNIEKKSFMKQLYSSFFSTSQLGATIICGGFFQKQVNPYLVFATLPAIQTSAFGMTLLRKNIINKQTWQIVYSIELILVYIIWYLEYNNFWILFYSFLAFLLRKHNVNKYFIWLICYLSTKFLLYKQLL